MPYAQDELTRLLMGEGGPGGLGMGFGSPLGSGPQGMGFSGLPGSDPQGVGFGSPIESGGAEELLAQMPPEGLVANGEDEDELSWMDQFIEALMPGLANIQVGGGGYSPGRGGVSITQAQNPFR